MSRVAVIIAAALLVFACQTMAEPPTTTQITEVTKLLDGLPSPSALQRANEALTKGDQSEARRQAAIKLLDTARERIPKLRPLIVEGANILDYPGLLAVGDTHYVDNRGRYPGAGDKVYRLVIGISVLSEEYVPPYILYVEFDQKGQILKVLRPKSMLTL